MIKTTNLREVKEGSLIEDSDLGKVMFNGIVPKEDIPIRAYDLAVFVYMHPVYGLVRECIPLREDGRIRSRGVINTLNEGSSQAKKYFELIKG